MAAKGAMTLAKRRKRLMKVAETDYGLASDMAHSYLATIEGATLEEQKILFRLLVSVHGLCERNSHQCPSEFSLQPNDFLKLSKRVSPMVRNWASRASVANASLEVTADWLWDQLSLCEGNDRVVALAVLLRDPLIPYAQVPGDLAVLKLNDYYEDARARVRGPLALIRRFERIHGSLPALDLAAALVTIMGQLESPDEKIVFLDDFISRHMGSHRHGCSPPTFLELLHQEGAPMAFGEEGGDEDHGETDEEEDEE